MFDRVIDQTVETPFLERTTQFVFDDTLGIPLQIIREPDQFDTSLRQVTTFNRLESDPTRRIQSVSVRGGWSDGPDLILEERVTSFEYDQEVIFPTRIKKHVDCNPNGTGCEFLVTDMRHDPRDGTLLGVVDASGVGAQAAFDSFGRVLREVRASGTTTTSYESVDASTVNGRNLPGKLRVVVSNSANGATTTRLFDSLGRTVQTSSSGLQTASVLQETEYAWGDLVDYVSRPHLPGDTSQGAIIQLYDDRWRLERRSFPDSTDIEFAVGQVGNLNVGSESGEITATARRDQNLNWSYAFNDFRGNKRRSVDEAGHPTRYGYAAFGTLEMIVDSHSNRNPSADGVFLTPSPAPRFGARSDVRAKREGRQWPGEALDGGRGA